MALTQFINKETAPIGNQPIQQAPAKFGELLSKSFRSTRDNYVTTSRSRLIDDQRNKRSQQFEELTGEKLDPKKASNYKPFVEPQTSIQLGLDPQNIDIMRQNHDNQYIEQYIKELKQKEPEKYKSILTQEELEENARKTARLSKKEFEEASIRSKGLTKFTASIAGSIGGVATDPVNIAALPFGATRGASILRTVLTEAGVNAGAELATQPFVAKWQKEIGEEYGFKEIAENVGLAALFGGGLAGVVKGAKPTAMTVYNKISSLKLKPSEKIAASYMAKVAHLKEAMPFIKKPKIVETKKHYDSIDATAKAFNEGRPLKPNDLKITESEFVNIDANIKVDNDSIKKVQLDELKRFQENPILEKQDLAQELQYKIDTLPQQILDKVQKLVEEKKPIKITDLEEPEIKMLESAGIKADSKGRINEKPLQKERAKRAEAGTLESTIGKERQHIEDYNQKLNVKNLANQDINKQVKNIDNTLSKNNVLDENIEPSFMDRILEENNNPEFLRVQETNFRTLAEEKPDLLISLDDGEYTLRELLEEFDSDENFIREITTCAIGK